MPKPTNGKKWKMITQTATKKHNLLCRNEHYEMTYSQYIHQLTTRIFTTVR